MANIKILLVEDEAIVAEDIASCLERMGYVVVDIVATGESAIATAISKQPDLVLMDIMLQGEMDGVEATQHICTTLNIPIIYLTANADENTLERAKITGPFGYILKPFKEKELRATIEISISRHQAEVESQKALAIAESLLQEVQESSELKSRYLSMASHEFRTPLSVIKVAASTLETYSQQLSEEKKQQSLQRILTAADSMNHLLEDVLMLGQVECVGGSELLPIPLELVSFCQELIEVLQLSAGDRYTLKLICSDQTLWATLDDKLLWHILNNLLSNAIKYSPEGGMISLTLSCQESEVCFQVQDQGIGMPSEYQKRLFEPFHRAGNVGRIPGTGLGLAIAKRSVDLHGGHIRVESEVDRGTIFIVTLPLTLT